MLKNTEITRRWQFMQNASVELALFWYEVRHLPEDEFVSALKQLSGLSVTKKPNKKYSNSYNRKGDIVCTPFVADIKNITDNKFCCKNQKRSQLKEANQILTEQAGTGPLDTIMRAVQIVCGEDPIYVYTSSRKSQHVMFHRFCTMLFCMAITIMSRQNPLAFGGWKIDGIDALDYRPIELAQSLARKTIAPPKNEQRSQLLSAINRGCRGICEYAEANDLIMNVLMKLIAEIINDKHRCSIKSNITDITLGKSNTSPVISNITPINQNGIGTMNKRRISKDLHTSVLRGLYGSIETMITNNGSANIPSMESNSSMMNYMLLSSDKRTNRLMLRTSATNLIFHKGFAA